MFANHGKNNYFTFSGLIENFVSCVSDIWPDMAFVLVAAASRAIALSCSHH